MVQARISWFRRAVFSFVLGGERRRSGDGILKMKIFQRRSLELLYVFAFVSFIRIYQTYFKF